MIVVHLTPPETKGGGGEGGLVDTDSFQYSICSTHARGNNSKIKMLNLIDLLKKEKQELEI